MSRRTTLTEQNKGLDELLSAVLIAADLVDLRAPQ
jgi:hypothetical protein